ncbi:MAG: Asp23/Gls24 family envelope stress response protein [Ruminococcaceae bacterium]|nr:Asp23/Gls24 family envelope stress response protein [Oscillospiraceae bacterium]
MSDFDEQSTSDVENDVSDLFDDNDNMMITDEAIAVMAGVAASEVKGVSGMSGGFAGGIAEVFGRRNLSKGVKVVTKNDSTTVDLYVIVKYGHRIPDLAFEIQENVKSTIESLSGITVDAVNIHIQGIDYSEDSEIKSERESDTE